MKNRYYNNPKTKEENITENVEEVVENNTENVEEVVKNITDPVETDQEVVENIIDPTETEQGPIENITDPVDNVEEKTEESTTENEDPVVEEKPSVLGTVYNCVKLNVRKEANKNASVIAVLDSGAVVGIDIGESNDYFYNVCFNVNGNDVKGYCVKDYIKIE
jgi:hypothetical protein